MTAYANQEFKALPESEYVLGGLVEAGSGESGISGICKNINFLWREYRFPLCFQVFHGEERGIAFENYKSEEPFFWRLRPFLDCSSFDVYVEADTTGIEGMVRIRSYDHYDDIWDENQYEQIGENMEIHKINISVPPNESPTSGWIGVSLNASALLEGNVTWVKSISIHPAELTESTTLPQWSETRYYSQYVPIDDYEYTTGNPLTTSLANKCKTNVAELYGTRLPQVLAWSEYYYATARTVLSVSDHHGMHVFSPTDGGYYTLRTLKYFAPRGVKSVICHICAIKESEGEAYVGVLNLTTGSKKIAEVTVEENLDWFNSACWPISAESVAVQQGWNYLAIVGKTNAADVVCAIYSISIWPDDKPRQDAEEPAGEEE